MNIFRKIGETVIETYQNLTRSKKKFYSNKVSFILLHDNREEETFKGVITADRTFAYCPDLEVAKVNPKIWKNGNELKIYLPESVGKIDYYVCRDMARADRKKVKLKLIDNLDKISHVEFETEGTIDWNMIKNDYVTEFDQATYKIENTTALRLLKEIPNWKFLFACAATFFMGLALGFFITQILNFLSALQTVT